MPFVHVIAERLPRQPPQGDKKAPVVEALAEPLDEDSAKAPSAKRLVGYEDLVPQARLLPALRRQLTATRTGSLDLDRLMSRCWRPEAATSSAPSPPAALASRTGGGAGFLPTALALPQKTCTGWRIDCCISAGVLAYRCASSIMVLSGLGATGWPIRICSLIAEPAGKDWKMPPAGTPVLIVSDLGLLLGAQSGAGQAWKSFIERLGKAQLCPVALVPLGEQQLDGTLPSWLPILRWSPDARARPERARGTGQPAPEGLEDLLAMAAVTRRVDPPLLRAMRRINPASAPERGPGRRVLVSCRRGGRLQCQHSERVPRRSTCAALPNA